MPMMLRAFLVWLVIIGVESVHGILRTLLLVPLIGDFRARQVSVLTGSVLIFAVAHFCIRWIAATTRFQLLGVGLLWVVLTVLFEIGLGRFGLGLSWDRITEDYVVTRGGMLGFGLLFMAASPWLAARLRSRSAAYPARGGETRPGLPK
jgi:hypothetical protein